ncbi:hypothetical protein PMES_02361 [Profundibacterium mesophilum KAUST100406-0324]|uniref:Uncharacterized protein n=1 Tax=Profundibacterium mesophilum KAUST100406-0324 TaxID=1037889 RepID=A0A921TCK3_9RHOB|nr:hypothetical protein PMES_02361 [Profundibacterium mesophilum KAUST100406-0324]
MCNNAPAYWPNLPTPPNPELGTRAMRSCGSERDQSESLSKHTQTHETKRFHLGDAVGHVTLGRMPNELIYIPYFYLDGGGGDTVIQRSLVQLSDDKVPSELYRTAAASS